MYNTTQLNDVVSPCPVAITTEVRIRPGAVRPHIRRAAAGPTGTRFNWVCIGFWLGGLALGTTGCLLGASIPCRHSVGVAICILWWGLYLGCLGASTGAAAGVLFGLCCDRPPASPSCPDAREHRPPVQAATRAPARGDLFTSRPPKG
jgi:hypothetical protein